MYIVGFVTADEAAVLADSGYEVEDASNYGLVSPFTEHRLGDDFQPGTPHDSYLMAKPEAGPDGTQAVAVFIDASVYRVLVAAKGSITLQPGSLNVAKFIARRDRLRARAAAQITEGEDFKYCSHKNPNGSDARYPTGNGETACVCGNKWD